MNKTLAVNIGGYAFNIEEQAYQQLKNYLDAIAQHFRNNAGKDEILADIEARLAELFTERLSGARNVVTPTDVTEVIAIMGKPEDYGDAEDEPGEAGTTASGARNENRSFYRDSEDAVIGGVAAGLSHSFGWDPILLRIVFVLLAVFGGAGIPIYIVLWIVMPEARTTAEKLRMKRSKINVDNISKAVNESFESVKESVNSKRTRDGMDQLAGGLGSFLGLIGRMLRVLVGLIMLLMGIGLAIAAIVGIVGVLLGTNVPPMLTSGFLESYFFLSSGWFVLSVVGLVLVAIVPIFGLLYGGIRLLLNIQSSVKGVGIVTSALFTVGVIICSVSAVFHVREFSQREYLTTSDVFSQTQSDTLFIAVNEDQYWHAGLHYRVGQAMSMVKVDGENIVFGHSLLRFRTTADPHFSLQIVRSSHGRSVNDAIANAREISYTYNLVGDTLRLDPVFKVPGFMKFKSQELTVTVNVPNGKSIQTSPSIARSIRHDHGLPRFNANASAGQLFINVNDSLFCRSCGDVIPNLSAPLDRQREAQTDL
jgi:phage shock protein PspC (stress-responsive transcriptional regulator)